VGRTCTCMALTNAARHREPVVFVSSLPQQKWHKVSGAYLLHVSKQCYGAGAATCCSSSGSKVRGLFMSVISMISQVPGIVLRNCLYMSGHGDNNTVDIISALSWIPLHFKLSNII
jgi:hypothetical protein